MEDFIEDQHLCSEKDEMLPDWRSLLTFSNQNHVPVLSLAVFVGIASGFIDPLFPIFLGRIFQHFTDFGSGFIESTELQDGVEENVTNLLGLAVATWLLNSMFLYFWILFGELQAESARKRLFETLLAKSAEYYDSMEFGPRSMIPRLQTHIRELQLATSQPLGFMFTSAISVGISFTVALRYDWQLTLILISTMPLNAFILQKISSRIVKSVSLQVEQLAMATKAATNAFAGIQTVKCFNGQQEEFNKFATSIRRAAGYYMKQVHGNALQIGYMRCMTLLIFMVGFWYGSHAVTSGKRTTSDIITAFLSCLQILESVQNLLPQMIVMEKGRVAGSILGELLKEKQNSYDQLNMKRPTTCTGQISFENVNFAYPARREHLILRNITCTFNVGTMNVIIGHSGSGKTTLTQLLLKFYSPDSGSIRVDGDYLEEVDTRWLRDNITVVEQHPVLFDWSVVENVTAGCHPQSTLSTKVVLEAIEFGLLKDKLENLQEGIDTRVGANGQLFSIGERQRLTLARARLRNTPILVLDEATSALDQSARFLLMSAIRAWRKEKTTIIISHDVSLINDKDFVYLFEDGTLISCGTGSDFKQSSHATISRYFASDSQAKYASKCPSDGSDHRSTSYMHSGSRHERVSQIQPNPSSFSIETNRKFAYDSSSSIPETDRILDDALVSPTFILSRSIHGAQSPLGPSRHRRKYFPSHLAKRRSSKQRYDAEPRCSSKSSWYNCILDSCNIELDILENEKYHSIDNKSSNTRPRIRNWCSRPFQNESSLIRILQTVWPSLSSRPRKVLLLGFTCATFHALCLPLFSWAFSNLFSTFYSEQEASQSAYQWSMHILGLSIIDGLACFGMHLCFEYSSQVWVDNTRLRAMKRILEQPLEFFVEISNTISEPAFNLDRNAEEMRNIIGRFISFVSVIVIVMLTTITWCLTVCWKLTLAGLLLAPVSWAILKFYQTISQKLEKKSNDASERAANVFKSTLTNIRTVWALNMDIKLRQKHNQSVFEVYNIGLNRSRICGSIFGLSKAVMIVNHCLILYFGAYFAASQTFTVQEILLVISLLIFALGNVTGMVAMIPQISSAKDTALRLLNLADLPQESHEHTGDHKASEIGDITFSNMYFSYKTRPALHNISATFSSGMVTALVGPSGSGKSTLASLILKLYKIPLDGHSTAPSLTIGGVALQRHHTKTLRDLIAIVPQEAVIFPATVSENIAYGLAPWSEEASLDSIHAAAVAAGIDDFLSSLPEGYNTSIGEGGLALSGGQIQRIAIARALLRKPKALILDEPTSALDSANAKLIGQTITRLILENSQMTIILITHSKEMTHLADHIIFLNEGRVVKDEYQSGAATAALACKTEHGK